MGPWQHHDGLNQSSVAAATPRHLPCSLLHIPAQRCSVRGSVFRKVCSLEYGSKLSWGWLMHFSQALLGELISTNVALSPESLLSALKVGLMFNSLLLQKCCNRLVNIWPYFKSMLLFLPQIFDSIHSDGLCCHLQRVCCHLGSLLLAFKAKADYLKPVCCTLDVHCVMQNAVNSSKQLFGAGSSQQPRTATHWATCSPSPLFWAVLSEQIGADLVSASSVSTAEAPIWAALVPLFKVWKLCNWNVWERWGLCLLCQPEGLLVSQWW